MSIMTDGEIKAALDDPASGLKIGPLSDAGVQIQPISVDLRLGNKFIAMDNGQKELHSFMQLRGGQVSQMDAMEKVAVDPREDQTEKLWHTVEIPDGNAFLMPPGAFILAEVFEHIELPDNIACRVDGRSSYGRLGIAIHVTAGVVEPGFKGRLTLEMTNVGPRPVKLYPGDRICQIVLYKTAVPAVEPYSACRDSKYQDQEGVTPSRVHLDYTAHVAEEGKE